MTLAVLVGRRWPILARTFLEQWRQDSVAGRPEGVKTLLARIMRNTRLVLTALLVGTGSFELVGPELGSPWSSSVVKVGQGDF